MCALQVKNYDKVKFVVVNALLSDKEYYIFFRFIVNLLYSVVDLDIERTRPIIMEGLELYRNRLEM